ncbi:hypothetical protein EMCRGX_G002172 [Ephydatia muelleri]
MAILFTLEIYILILLLSVFMNRALRWLGMEESYFGQLAQWLQRWLILPVTGIMWIIRWLVVRLRDCFGFARQLTRGKDIVHINITRPVSEVIEKLCYYLSVEDSEVYVLYLTGSCLTSLRETGVDSGDDAAIHFKVNRKGSFIHLVDHQALPDQGNDPILLKNNLSLKMQGITTSRILLLQREQDVHWPVSNIVLSPEDEFNKCWLSIVQGNTPCSMEQAVRLAAIQYQAYVQHRTAMNSTWKYAGVRGIDQKMYKEQESLNLKSEKDIYTTYRTYYTSLLTHDTIFFPAREPRRKLLHSTKLKPILIGVNSKGVLRVDHRTKEVLDMWEYQVLKNWAYSKRTFVLAFANKNYPMESIQAKWISTLVDFHVDSILDSAASLGKLIADANNNQ